MKYVWQFTIPLVLIILVVTCSLPACAPPQVPALQQKATERGSPSTPPPVRSNQPSLLSDKIKHIVIIMQENRSLDEYFGTYPGADGIPMQNGVPTVCVNDPQTNECIRPYHDPHDVNAGGSARRIRSDR